MNFKEYRNEIMKNNRERVSLWYSTKMYLRWRKEVATKAMPLEIGEPWITIHSRNLLLNYIRENKKLRVFEYGTGGSTLFFLKNGVSVTSVEHDQDWYQMVCNQCQKKYPEWAGYLELPVEQEANIDLDPSEPLNYSTDDKLLRQCSFENYVKTIENFDDRYFDIVLVDGRSRPACIAHAVRKIKEGGLLVLDNSEREYYTINNSENLKGFDLISNFYGPIICCDQFSRTSIYLKNETKKKSRIQSVSKAPNWISRFLPQIVLNKKNHLTFEKIKLTKNLMLYAGNLPPGDSRYNCYIGLSYCNADDLHIKHDVRDPYPLNENTVERYQAEDVFEHVEYDKVVDSFNEIFRILKPGGVFRCSLPDYRCDLIKNRCLYSVEGEIVFDPGGGGIYNSEGVKEGGHLWFPIYEKVVFIIEESFFELSKARFYHYYDSNGNPVLNQIDYSKGWIQRTPDNDERVKQPYRPLSIVVDLVK